MTKKTENNATDEFSYDAASRLTGITSKKNGAWFGKASAFYAYDEADNIVRLQDNSGKLQFTHNTDNFLQTQQGTVNQAWRSDLNGNVLEDADNTYQWDAANRLYGLTSKRSLGSTTFLRDGLDRMAAITEADNPRAGTTRYLWCGMQSVTPCAQLDGNGNVKQLYFPHGEWRADKPQAPAIYYQRDHLGSVRYVTDANGKLIGTQDYSAYGVIVRRSGVTGQLGYAGVWQHETSGLNLTCYRPYNPRTMRRLNNQNALEM